MSAITFSRRRALQLAGAAALAPLAAPQTQPVGIRGLGIDHLSIQVSDMQRSLDFYRKLCGMTMVSEDRSKEIVRIGYGKRYLISLRRIAPYALLDHYAIAVDNPDNEAIAARLKSRGVVAQEGDDAGFHVKDPDGVKIQLTASSPAPVPNSEGIARIRMLHHVNTQVTDVGKSEAFYRMLLGFKPSRRVQGPDNHGLDFPEGGLVILQTSKTPGRLDHFCLGAENFDADRMRSAAAAAFPGKVQGTAKDNIIVLDPDGVRVQISATDWSA